MTLILLNPSICHDCGDGVYQFSAFEDALFSHGGYGATRRTTWRMCVSCRTNRVIEVCEIRPPRS